MSSEARHLDGAARSLAALGMTNVANAAVRVVPIRFSEIREDVEAKHICVST
jgi:hypothetical protein